MLIIELDKLPQLFANSTFIAEILYANGIHFTCFYRATLCCSAPRGTCCRRVCLSVRSSVTGRYFIKTAKCRIPSPDLTPWPHRAFRSLDLPVSTSGPGPGDDPRGAQGAISPTAAGQKSRCQADQK